MASNPHSMSIKQDLSSPFTDEDTEAQRTQPEVTEFLGTINLPQAQEAEMKRAAARAASGGDKTSTLHSLSFWAETEPDEACRAKPGARALQLQGPCPARPEAPSPLPRWSADPWMGGLQRSPPGARTQEHPKAQPWDPN